MIIQLNGRGRRAGAVPAERSHGRHKPESRRQRDGGIVVIKGLNRLRGQMSMWRIRITLSDDPPSRARFAEALADRPVRLVSVTPRGNGTADLSGEAIVELAQDDGLSDLLTALHHISPQVFVSRADPAQLAGAQDQPAGAAERPAGPTGLAAVPSQPQPETPQASWRAAAAQHLPGITLGS
jgi:hypothetical protein